MSDAKTTTMISIAPVVRDEAHAARIDSAARALDDARGTVCDAALTWSYDEDDPEARDGMRAAVRAWRDASEAFLRAVAGRQ